MGTHQEDQRDSKHRVSLNPQLHERRVGVSLQQPGKVPHDPEAERRAGVKTPPIRKMKGDENHGA
jgi:hypothetical protein